MKVAYVDHKECQVKQELLVSEVQWDLKVNQVPQDPQVPPVMDQVAR